MKVTTRGSVTLGVASALSVLAVGLGTGGKPSVVVIWALFMGALAFGVSLLVAKLQNR